MAANTTLSIFTNTSVTGGAVTSLPTEAHTMTQVATTVAGPTTSDSLIIGGVISLILLTVVALGILLYCYLCHNKGAYRTTGELAPGEDPEEDYSNRNESEKKEYFI